MNDSLIANYQLRHVTVQTIPEGAVLTGDIRIPVTISYEQDLTVYPDTVRMEIYRVDDSEVVLYQDYLYSVDEDRYTLFDEGDGQDVAHGTELFSPYESGRDLDPSNAAEERTNAADPADGPSSASDENVSGSSSVESPAGEVAAADELSDAAVGDEGAADPLGGESAADESAFSGSNDPSEVSYDLIVSVPAQTPGRYNFRFSFFHNEQSIGSKEIPFFFAPGEAVVDSVEIFPLVVYPGGEALVLADIVSADASNAYVRVTFGDREVAAGRVEELGDSIRLQAPEEENLYPLVVETFPFAPQEPEADFLFLSPYRLQADIYVSPKQSPQGGELSEEGRFLLLHHFRGEFLDYSQSWGREFAQTIGKPLLDMSEGFFGYRFDGGSALVYENLNLPVDQGNLLPFSVHLSTHFPVGGESVIFKAANETIEMDLGRSYERLPYVEFRFQDAVYRSSVPDSFEPEDFAFRPLTLSLFPDGESTELLWYRDGQIFHRDRFPVVFQGLSEKGRSMIGGSGHFGGIIDEFAIYHKTERGKPSIDPHVFQSALERDLKKRLVYAEGFDSLYLSAYDMVFAGDVKPAGSRLELNSGASVELRVKPEVSSRLNVTVDIEAAASQGSRLTFVSGILSRKLEFAQLDLGEGVFRFGEEQVPVSGYDGLLQFSLIKTVESLLIEVAGVRYESGLSAIPSDFAIHIEAGEGSEKLNLNGIVIDSMTQERAVVSYRQPLITGN